jgi:predicted GNAT family N-acyltransferase
MPASRQRRSEARCKPAVNKPESYTVSSADWQRDAVAIRALRHAVFIEEQGIPAALEWDGLDAGCLHVLARDSAGHAIATGRLLPEGRIGRMAVLPAWRGRGIGHHLLCCLVELAVAQGHKRVYLHAQQDVAGFYRVAGFREYGAPFTEAGIMHVAMVRDSV